MIRRSTVVYIVLLLGLVGAYYFLKNRPPAADAEPTETAVAVPSAEIKYLFPAEAGTPSGIRIESKSGEAVEVARDAENAWVLVQPEKAKADQGGAEAAASQATTIRIVDSVPDVDLKVVGLEVPEYVLTITFTSGGKQTVDVGTVTPSETGYYARDAAGKVVIVSKDAIDALLGMLKNPPYAETPTPSPTPATTETPAVQTPEAVTPSSTATP
jgi:hypothetical protein